MRRKKEGVTIPELLITMGIFALMMTVICVVFERGFYFYREGSGDTYAFQHAVISLDRMSRDLGDHSALELYYPDLDTLGEASRGIVFVKEYPEEERFEVIGYCLNRETGELARVLYNPGYDPAVASTQTLKSGPGARSIIARQIGGLTFQAQDRGLLSIGIVIKGDHRRRYLRTMVRNEALTQ